MKVYVAYSKDIMGWKRNHLDLELMLYEGHVLPSGNALLRQIKNLRELGYVIEQNKTIFVLREPMELQGGQIDYEAVEFNIDFIINSSHLLFVEPKEEEEVETPPLGKGFVEYTGKPR